MRHPFADVPAILAASEQDSLHIAELSTRLTRCLVYFADPRTAVQHMRWLPRLSCLLYHSLTWLSNSKSLGEEYSLLQPVDVFSRSSPSWFIRLLHVVLSVFALPSLPRPLRTLLMPLHLVLFYYNGKYLDPVRRLLGIRYVQSHRPSHPARHAQYCLLLCTLINSMLDIKEQLLCSHGVHQQDAGAATPKLCPPEEQCPLCFGPRVHSTVTPCGHVFCWDCISPWLLRFPQCPLCRVECQASFIYTVNL